MVLNKPILTLIVFLFCNQLVKAQVGTWELGLMAGGAGYIGELNPENPLKISGFSAGAYVKRNFNQHLGARLNYSYGQIQANDAESGNAQLRARNLNFKTSLNELSALIDFNFFDLRLAGGTKRFTPYLFTGAGIVVFSPTATYGDTKYQLSKFLPSTEGLENGYKNIVLTIPYGAGLRYNYKDSWSIFSEIGYRTPLTDYIDDVSRVYPDEQVFVGDSPSFNLSDPSVSKIGIPGTQRGDFRKRDTYLFVSVGISFTFVSSKCYSF